VFVTRAEKLNDTGCWQAVAHGAVRSMQAVCLTDIPPEVGVSPEHLLTIPNLALIGFLRIPRS